jgi:hypothetical protein
MKKILFLLMCTVFLNGCFSIDSFARNRLNFISYTGVNYAPQPKDYPVDLFFEGSPSRNYEIIGELMGAADTGDQVRPMLEARARQVGADAVINIVSKARQRIGSEIVEVPLTGPRGYTRDVPVSKTYSYEVINIRAKLIKYK